MFKFRRRLRVRKERLKLLRMKQILDKPALLELHLTHSEMEKKELQEESHVRKSCGSFEGYNFFTYL